MPKASIHKLDDEEIVVIIRDAYPELVNVIRRSAIRNVPTLAIDNVYIRDLDAGMPDERIALRLGLVPIKGPVEKYEKLLEEKPRMSIPGNILKETIVERRGGKPDVDDIFTYLFGKPRGKTKIPAYIVRTSDMKIFAPDVEPLYDMPLFIILAHEDTACDVRFEITIGRGKEHAKRSPVTVAASSYMPKIEIKDPSRCESCTTKACVEACPYGALTYEDGKVKLDREKCDLCELCMRACDNIRVYGDENEIVLRIESDGRLDPKYIFCRAIDEAIKELDKLEEIVKRSLEA